MSVKTRLLFKINIRVFFFQSVSLYITLIAVPYLVIIWTLTILRTRDIGKYNGPSQNFVWDKWIPIRSNVPTCTLFVVTQNATKMRNWHILNEKGKDLPDSIDRTTTFADC